MRRTNKAGEWQELLVLTEGDIVRGASTNGPAIRVTFARYGREVRYSHTPGVADDEGSFRPVQHLHDRNAQTYLLLLQYAHVAVTVSKQLDPEMVAQNPYGLKRSLRDAIETLDAEKEDKLASFPQEKKAKARSQKPISKPTLGVSIGEMLKAKQGK